MRGRVVGEGCDWGGAKSEAAKENRTAAQVGHGAQQDRNTGTKSPRAFVEGAWEGWGGGLPFT